MTPFLAVFLPLCVAYLGTAMWIWQSWMLPESFYAHGPIVVVVAALVVWKWRGRWRSLPIGIDRRGWTLLLPGLLLHLAGSAMMIDSLSAASLCLTIPGAVLLACGAARWRACAAVLWLPLFAVPMPVLVSSALAFELKEVATSAGLWIAELAGVAAWRDGSEIAVGPSARLQVAEPCSGLRSLVSLATLGYCIAFFLGDQRGVRRWALLALAFPLAFISNVLRIAAIIWMAEAFGAKTASGVGHDIVTYGVWAVDLGLLILADVWLSRWARRRA